MATNPQSAAQSVASLYLAAATDAPLNTLHELVVSVAIGTSTPPSSPSGPPPTTNGSFLAAGQDVTCAYAIANVTTLPVDEVLRTGVGAWLFRDDTDGAGAGTGALGFFTIFAEGNMTYGQVPTTIRTTGTFTIPGSLLTQPGSYKLVLVAWSTDDAGNPNINQVSDGTATTKIDEWFFDSDGNFDFSNGPLDDPIFNTNGGFPGYSSDNVGGKWVGWMRVMADAQTLSTSVTPNQRYAHQPTVTLDPTAAAGLNNPKQVRCGLIPSGSAITVGSLKEKTVTPPSNGGSVTSTSYNVDTVLPSAPVAHKVRAYVGPVGGQSSTPSAEQPDIITGAPNFRGAAGQTTDKAWVVFASSGLGAGLARVSSSPYMIENTTDVNIGSGFSIFEESSFTTPGATVHDNSARTILNRLFTRTDSTLPPHDHPWLRTFVKDAFGVAFPNAISFLFRVDDSDGTNEVSQAVTTASGTGQLTHDFDCPATMKAFNRFKRTSPDNPDSLGTHDIAIPIGSVNRPETAKSGSYPDPKSPATTRSFAASTYPSRAKDVVIRGNAFAGVNEPSASDVDVFGVNSEIIFAGMWSGNTTDRTVDANGVPTGPVVRSKPTAGGSYAMKTADIINESAFAVGDPTRHNPTDVAGRVFDYTGTLTWLGRRGLFNRTLSSTTDTGTDLTVTEELDGPLGYSVHAANSTQTFDLISAPSDATTYGYYQGFARTSAQRSSFGLTAGATEIPGFTSDSGNYGYKVQIVDFSIVRDDLAIILATNRSEVYPGFTTVFTAHAVQILPDNSLLTSTFDGAPQIYIHQVDAQGLPLVLVATATMVAVPSSNDYEFQYTPSTAQHSNGGSGFAATVFGKVKGSRPAPGRALFMTGRRNPAYQLIAGISNYDISNPDSGKSHFRPGVDPLFMGLQLRDAQTTGNKKGVVLDAAPKASLFRFSLTNGLEYLDPADLRWKAASGVDVPQFTLAATADPTIWASFVATTATAPADAVWTTDDIFAIFTATQGGVLYTSGRIELVVASTNDHGDPPDGVTDFIIRAK